MNRAATELLNGLDDQQRAAVLAPLGPVRILAGAGTGKTRTITHRIAYHALTGQVDPRQTLAVTHSAKAAAEMRERLTHMGVTGVQVRTFPAAALRQLSYFWEHTGLPGHGPQLVSAVRGGRYGLIRTALAQVLGVHPKVVESTDVTDLDGEITWARARRVAPWQYAAAATAAYRARTQPAAVLAEGYRAYEAAKREQELVDFDDLLSFTAQLLENSPVVATAVRGSYTTFLVDEYQDTDPAQQRLLDAWLGDRRTITVCGDAQQAIYAFKGGEPALIDTFTDRFTDAVSVSLVKDYRSTPQVVSLANRVLAAAPGPRVTLEGQQPDGPDPVVRTAPTEAAEERGIAARVRELIASGTPPSEIAVLHRFNTQAVRLRAALADAGVPVAGGTDTRFFERPEIVAALKALTGRAQRDPGQHGTAALSESLAATGFDRHRPPAGAGAARERWEAQSALADLGRSLSPQHTGTAQALLDELTRRARDEHEPRLGGVTVCTIHKSKGLEWDAVLLARLTEGSLPSVFATTPAELAEERRLFYVALTRARRTLELWHADERGDGGRRLDPCRFLREALPGRPAPSSRGKSARRSRPAGRAASGPARPVRRSGTVYAPRDRVTHESFGLGWVTALEGAYVVVDFGATGVRKVACDSAKLEKL